MNILDAEDAFFQADVSVGDWWGELLAEWNAPKLAAVVGTVLAEMDDETLKMLKEMQPEAYDQVMKIVGGNKHARSA